MPFTVTHILAVTPLAKFSRYRLPLSALMIGSMVPDFPLFFPIGLKYQVTHSFLGILTVCLPLGLALFVIFHRVMSQPLYALLNPKLRGQFVPFLAAPESSRFQRTLTIAFCISVGALTHVVWDAFTHSGRWGVDLFPSLNETLFTTRGKQWPGFKVFQHGSSLFGLPILFGMVLIWMRRAPVHSVSDSIIPDGARRCLVGLFILLPIILGIVLAPELAQQSSRNPSTERLLFHFVTVDLSSFLYLLLLYSLCFHGYRSLFGGSSN